MINPALTGAQGENPPPLGAEADRRRAPRKFLPPNRCFAKKGYRLLNLISWSKHWGW